jgi:hypothetical protein
MSGTAWLAHARRSRVETHLHLIAVVPRRPDNENPF